MKFAGLKRLAGLIDRLNEWIGKKVSWISAFLVLLICFDVLFRYLFSISKIWVIELEWHLFGLLFLLSAAYTWKHDQHVRVDVFYERFSEKKKALVNLIGVCFFLIPWCILVIATSFDYAMNSLYFRETSPNPNGLPARYVIKFVITLSFVLLLLQTIPILIRSLEELTPVKQAD